MVPFWVTIPTGASQRWSANSPAKWLEIIAPQRPQADRRPSGARGRAFESRRAHSGS
jgi:hypothetical protein